MSKRKKRTRIERWINQKRQNITHSLYTQASEFSLMRFAQSTFAWMLTLQSDTKTALTQFRRFLLHSIVRFLYWGGVVCAGLLVAGFTVHWAGLPIFTETHAAGPLGFGGQIIVLILTALYWIVILPFTLAFAVVGYLFYLIMTYPFGSSWTSSAYASFANVPAVVYGWGLVRDLSNMFFALILIIIALGTVLRVEQYSWKQLLPKLILMALLINFSKTIAGIFTDFATVVMATFGSGFSVGFFEKEVLVLMGLDSMTQLAGVGDNVQDLSNQNIGQIVLAFIMACLFLIIACVVMVVFTVTLVFRIAMLWFLIVLSPFAYVTRILPVTQKYASQWWEMFGRYVVVGPLVVFFLWLSFMMAFGQSNQGNPIVQGVKSTSTNITVTPPGTVPPNPTANSDANAVQPATWIQFLIAIMFLMASLKFVNQMASEFGGVIGKVQGGAFGAAKALAKFGPQALQMAGNWLRTGKDGQPQKQGAWSKRAGTAGAIVGSLLQPLDVASRFTTALKARTKNREEQAWSAAQGETKRVLEDQIMGRGKNRGVDAGRVFRNFLTGGAMSLLTTPATFTEQFGSPAGLMRLGQLLNAVRTGKFKDRETLGKELKDLLKPGGHIDGVNTQLTEEEAKEAEEEFPQNAQAEALRRALEGIFRQRGDDATFVDGHKSDTLDFGNDKISKRIARIIQMAENALSEAEGKIPENERNAKNAHWKNIQDQRAALQNGVINPMTNKTPITVQALMDALKDIPLNNNPIESNRQRTQEVAELLDDILPPATASENADFVRRHADQNLDFGDNDVNNAMRKFLESLEDEVEQMGAKGASPELVAAHQKKIQEIKEKINQGAKDVTVGSLWEDLSMFFGPNARKQEARRSNGMATALAASLGKDHLARFLDANANGTLDAKNPDTKNALGEFFKALNDQVAAASSAGVSDKQLQPFKDSLKNLQDRATAGENIGVADLQSLRTQFKDLEDAKGNSALTKAIDASYASVGVEALLQANGGNLDTTDPAVAQALQKIIEQYKERLEKLREAGVQGDSVVEPQALIDLIQNAMKYGKSIHVDELKNHGINPEYLAKKHEEERTLGIGWLGNGKDFIHGAVSVEHPTTDLENYQEILEKQYKQAQAAGVSDEDLTPMKRVIDKIQKIRNEYTRAQELYKEEYNKASEKDTLTGEQKSPEEAKNIALQAVAARNLDYKISSEELVDIGDPFANVIAAQKTQRDTFVHDVCEAGASQLRQNIAGRNRAKYIQDNDTQELNLSQNETRKAFDEFIQSLEQKLTEALQLGVSESELTPLRGKITELQKLSSSKGMAKVKDLGEVQKAFAEAVDAARGHVLGKTVEKGLGEAGNDAYITQNANVEINTSDKTIKESLEQLAQSLEGQIQDCLNAGATEADVATSRDKLKNLREIITQNGMISIGTLRADFGSEFLKGVKSGDQTSATKIAELMKNVATNARHSADNLLGIRMDMKKRLEATGYTIDPTTHALARGTNMRFVTSEQRRDAKNLAETTKARLAKVQRELFALQPDASYETRMTEEPLISAEMKKIQDLNDVQELINYFARAVKTKNNFLAEAIIRKVSQTKDMNTLISFMSGVTPGGKLNYFARADGMGMEYFRQHTLMQELGMSEEKSLRVMSDAGYILEKQGDLAFSKKYVNKLGRIETTGDPQETQRSIYDASTGEMIENPLFRADRIGRGKEHADLLTREALKSEVGKVARWDRKAWGVEARDGKFEHTDHTIGVMKAFGKDLLDNRHWNSMPVNAKARLSDPVVVRAARAAGVDKDFCDRLAAFWDSRGKYIMEKGESSVERSREARNPRVTVSQKKKKGKKGSSDYDVDE